MLEYVAFAHAVPHYRAPRWIADAWPLEHPRYVGRDLTWAEWMALPDLPR